MRNRRSADRSTFSTIWLATRIVWPFPIIGLADFKDGKVTFRWKDYAHGNKRQLMTVTAEEFLRRFLLHTLPRGFVRIRFLGFLANRQRTGLLTLCRQTLETNPRPHSPSPPTVPQPTPGTWTCPLCGGPMIVIERLTAQQILAESTRKGDFIDTS
jgi:hypothetical protein